MSAADETALEDDEDGPQAGAAGAGSAGGLRLDKWLWFARVTKSRTQAAGLVSEGKVRVNRERVDKPSTLVKVGDVLTIAVHSRVRVLEVAKFGARRGPAVEAQTLYKDLTPPPPPKDETVEPPALREPGTGRPTKRDRRRIIGFTDQT